MFDYWITKPVCQSHICCVFTHHNYDFQARKLWWIRCFSAYFGLISVLCACQRGWSWSPDRYVLANLSITVLCKQYSTGTIRFCNSLQNKDIELWRIWKVQTSVEPCAWHICCEGHLYKTGRWWAVFWLSYRPFSASINTAVCSPFVWRCWAAAAYRLTAWGEGATTVSTKSTF